MPLTEKKSETENLDVRVQTQGSTSLADTASSLFAVITDKKTRDASLRRLSKSSILRSLIAVLLGSLILRLSAQMMTQMLQFYFDTINNTYYPISYSIRGLIIASFFIPEMFGSPILGAMSDRYGRKFFILLGPILGALAVQITSMTTAIWLLVFTRLLEGLSTASSIPATLGYISEVTAGRPKLRARIVGLFELTLVGGLALGAVIGGYLWKYFSKPMIVAGVHLISPAFALNGLVYLISLAIFYWGITKTRRPRSLQTANSHFEWRRVVRTLRAPNVWRFVPAWLAIFSIIGLWTNHSPGLLTGESHLPGQILMGNISPAQFGNGFAVLAIFFATGLLVWSFYLGRYRKTNVMLVTTTGLFLTLLAVYSLNHLSSLASPFYYPLMGALLLGLLILSGFTPAALTYLADITESHKEDRGSIMGLYSVFLGVGQVVGTTIGGKFADWMGIDGLLLLSVIFGIIMVWTLVQLRKQELPVAQVAASSS